MERQTVGAQVINNTLLSCVISSLQKINEFYTGASTLKIQIDGNQSAE